MVSEALRGQLTLFPAPRELVRLTAVAHASPCRWCRTMNGVLARVLLAPAGKPDFFVEANWTVEGLAAWVSGVLARAGALTHPLLQRKEHRSNIGSVYDCSGCGKTLFVHSRPKDRLESWRRSATDAPVERCPTLTVGDSFLLNAMTMFTPRELQWFRGAAGGSWIVRKWLITP